MCGRLNIYNKESIYDIMRMYTDDVIDQFDTGYNIAPGAQLAGLYKDEQIKATAMHWGLIPLWAKPDTFKRPLINARAETIFEKPSFRSLMKAHRCLVPVNGFYEWQRRDDRKAPYHFVATDSDVLLLAGIYQFNKQGKAECCLVTTEANAVMEPVHHRMPVSVESDAVDDWLASTDRSQLEQLMLPAAVSELRSYEVSTYVSRAGNEGEKCIQAVV